MYAASSLYLEFLSLLRKGVNRRDITNDEAQGFAADLVSMRLSWVAESPQLCLEAFQLANQLNQSDIFDCAGYVIARSLGAEFITSDRRFARAASAAALPGIRFIA